MPMRASNLTIVFQLPVVAQLHRYIIRTLNLALRALRLPFSLVQLALQIIEFC